MDHILHALDEHIAHQEWLLKCERNAREALEKEMDELKAENNRLKRIGQGIQSGENALDITPTTASENGLKESAYES